MSITKQELFKLSELSKLDIDQNDANINKIIENLNNVLTLVDQLNDLQLNNNHVHNINNIEPIFHSDNLEKQRLRLDIVNEINNRDLLQSIAPANSIESGLYLVPKVLEE